MEQVNYLALFEEALSKAFAAHTSNVRDAYLDLAGYYYRKLPGRAARDAIAAWPSCHLDR